MNLLIVWFYMIKINLATYINLPYVTWKWKRKRIHGNESGYVEAEAQKRDSLKN